MSDQAAPETPQAALPLQALVTPKQEEPVDYGPSTDEDVQMQGAGG